MVGMFPGVLCNTPRTRTEIFWIPNTTACFHSALVFRVVSNVSSLILYQNIAR